MKWTSLVRTLARSLAIFGAAACAYSAEGAASGSSAPTIRSAELVQHGMAVEIRTSRGVQVFDPGRGDTAFAGYETPAISPDGRAVAWLEDASAPISDANYPEPTGAWLFAGGRLVGSAGCDWAGEPFKFHFDGQGRSLVLVCSFPHGSPGTHEVTFEVASDHCLSDVDVESGKRRPCRKDPFH